MDHDRLDVRRQRPKPLDKRCFGGLARLDRSVDAQIDEWQPRSLGQEVQQAAELRLRESGKLRGERRDRDRACEKLVPVSPPTLQVPGGSTERVMGGERSVWRDSDGRK